MQTDIVTLNRYDYDVLVESVRQYNELIEDKSILIPYYGANRSFTKIVSLKDTIDLINKETLDALTKLRDRNLYLETQLIEQSVEERHRKLRRPKPWWSKLIRR